ncbi:hypothetical protein GCM10020001_055310 [Nonomuraea salmonea]
MARLLVAEVHGRADEPPVVLGGQPVHDLQRGVLDHVGDELGGDLLGHHDALAVRPDLGEHPGQQLDGVGGGPAVAAVAQQPVRLLDDDDVPQPGRALAPGAHAQVLDDADDQRAHEERLVLVVGDVLDGEHDVAFEQAADVGGVAALEETPCGADAQGAQPQRDEALDVGLHLAAVADLLDDVHGVLLELFEGGDAGRDVGARHGAAGDDVPAGGLVDALQGQRHDLRERLLGVERGHEQRPDHVDVGLDGVAGLGFERVDAERHAVGGPTG